MYSTSTRSPFPPHILRPSTVRYGLRSVQYAQHSSVQSPDRPSTFGAPRTGRSIRVPEVVVKPVHKRSAATYELHRTTTMVTAASSANLWPDPLMNRSPSQYYCVPWFPFKGFVCIKKNSRRSGLTETWYIRKSGLLLPTPRSTVLRKADDFILKSTDKDPS